MSVRASSTASSVSIWLFGTQTPIGRSGSRPARARSPRKYVITSKAVGAAPQYTLRIKDWKTDAPVSADAFAFTPPAGASKVALEALVNFDEVPPGIIAGAKQ